MRLPNFLDVEPIPFDAATFQEEEDGDDDFVDDLIKLKVENTLRWKYIKDRNGNMVVKQT